MPGTLVEKATCESCGTKVRDGSVFCFNCGESLAAEPLPPPIVKPETGTLNGRKRSKGAAIKDAEPAPIIMPAGELLNITEEPSAKTSAMVERPRRPRPIKKTPAQVEVEWVERSGPSVAYIIGSLVLVLLTIAFLAAAMYLK